MDELAEGAEDLGAFEGEMVGHHPVGGHVHIREAHGPARGAALPDAVPVVDDRDPEGVVRDEGRGEAVVRGECEDRDPMGEQGTGGVVLGAGQGVRAVGAGLQTGGELQRVPGALLREGVAEPASCQQLGVEEVPLTGRAVLLQHLHEEEVVLRNLADAAVGRGQQPDDLPEGARADLGTAMGAGHRDAQQPGGGQPVELGARQDAFGVAQSGVAGELGGQLGRDGDRLGVVGDHLRHRGFPVPAKGTWAEEEVCRGKGCCHRPCASSLGRTPSPNQ